MSEVKEKVILLVEGHRFRCHKNLLSKHSEYFTAMFNSNMQESNAGEIELKDVSADGFQLVMDFICSGTLNLTCENVYLLVPIVCMLQFTSLIEPCSEFLFKMIQPRNCLSVLFIADKFSLNHVYEKAKAYASWHFSQINRDTEFLNLPKESLKLYLNNSCLNVTSEFKVFEALMKWISYEYDERRFDFEELKTCVRFNCISNEEFQDGVLQHYFLKNSSLKEMLIEYRKKQISCNLQERQVPQSMLLITEHLNKLVIEYAHTDTREVELLDDPPTQLFYGMGIKACVVGKDLYLSGGERKLGQGSWMMNMWRYDPISKTWDEATKLIQPRRHHAVCCHGDNLYLIGGFGRHRVILDKVECYNTKTGVWEDLPPLKECTFSAVATVCMDVIYVIKTHFQCYDINKNQWVIKQSPVTFDNGLQSATSYGSKVYLLGQYSPVLWEYDPLEHAVTQLVKFDCPGVGSIKHGRYYMLHTNNGDQDDEENHNKLSELDTVVQVYDIESSKLMEPISLTMSDTSTNYVACLFGVRFS